MGQNCGVDISSCVFTEEWLHQGWLVWSVMSLTFPCALLHVYQDVEDEDTLKAVEAAVRESTSVKRIEVTCMGLNWTNVATAVLKGVVENTSLRELTLMTPPNSPPPRDVVDKVKQKKRLILKLY